MARHPELQGELSFPVLINPFRIGHDFVAQVASKYPGGGTGGGPIYRRIEEKKGKGQFVTEVSMDETDSPADPAELLIILAAIADEGIPFKPSRPNLPAVSTRAWITSATWRNSAKSSPMTLPLSHLPSGNTACPAT